MFLTNQLAISIYRTIYGSSLNNLFYGGGAGFSFDPTNFALSRQTFNMPATEASSAGDPIGLMLPAQAPESLTNRLIWTDGFSTTSAWTATNVTVTANTNNDSGVGNTDGASPVADTLNATVAGGSISQSYTCTADTAVRTATADLEAGTATNSTVELEYTGGNTYIAAISWSGGVPTVTHSGSAGASDVGAELQASGIYKIRVRGANNGRSTALIRIKPAASGTGTVFASRAQVNDGSTVLAYQPNAGCLGGSNRRSGGANQFTWSQDVANPAWTKSATSAADDGTVTATAGLATHTICRQSAVVTVSGVQYTYVQDVERGNYDTFQIYAFTSAGAGHVNYDINTLTVAETTATGTVTAIGGNVIRLTFTYTAASTADYPAFIFVPSLASARAASWTAAGTETVKFVRAWRVFGSSVGTYTRNMGVLGGLITNVPLYQTTSGNRPLLARFPKTGIRQLSTNSAFSGAVAGTPGTVPTGWTFTDSANYARTIVGSGTTTVGGVTLPYIDVQWVVAPGAAAGSLFYPSMTGGKETTAYVSQYYMQVISGTATRMRFVWQDGVTTVNRSYFDVSTTALTAYSNTYTTSAGATLARPLIGSEGSVGGTTFTLRIAGPQLEFGSTPTTFQSSTSTSDITESGVGYNYLPLYDGTSDFMTPGMQSWGTTQLLAAAQYAFTIFFVFRTVSASGGCIISQNNGAATAAMMFSLFVGSSTGAIGLNARGTAATAWGSDNRDGVFHVGALRWNGTSVDQILDSGALTAVTWAGGTLAATAIDIAVGMERVSTAARPFNGHLGVAFIDRACTNAEMLSAVRSLNAVYRAGL